MTTESPSLPFVCYLFFLASLSFCFSSSSHLFFFLCCGGKEAAREEERRSEKNWLYKFPDIFSREPCSRARKIRNGWKDNVTRPHRIKNDGLTQEHAGPPKKRGQQKKTWKKIKIRKRKWKGEPLANGIGGGGGTTTGSQIKPYGRAERNMCRLNRTIQNKSLRDWSTWSMDDCESWPDFRIREDCPTPSLENDLKW